MLEPGKIGSKQAVFLMLSTVLPTAILTIPANTVRVVQQDAWLSVMMATMTALFIAWLVVTLSSRFPGKTLCEYAEDILGKPLGKIVCLLYIWLFFLYSGSGAIRQFGFYLVTAMMPDTPMIVFTITVVAVAAYVVRNGLEVLCRFNQLFIPVTGLLVIVFLLSTIEMKPSRLLPVLDVGLLTIVKGSVMPAMLLGEIVFLAMIIPFLNKPEEAKRIAILATLFNGFILTVSTLEALLIFGPNLAVHWLYPTFNAVRVVSIANFFERLESVIVAFWVLGGFVKAAVFYYAAVLGSAQCLNLKDYRPLVLPVGVILVAFSTFLHGENIVEMLYYIAQVQVPFFLIVFELGFPLLLLIVALTRGKGGQSS